MTGQHTRTVLVADMMMLVHTDAQALLLVVYMFVREAVVLVVQVLLEGNDRLQQFFLVEDIWYLVYILS